MLSFLDKQNLQEKQIILANDKPYEQALFLIGGSGSGKGFAGDKFISTSSYKIIDTDDFKKSYVKLAKLKNKHPEIQNLDMRNPEDTRFLHLFLKEKGIYYDFIETLFGSKDHTSTRPNVLFDITLQDRYKLNELSSLLLSVGYESQNMHVVWILTNYDLALVQNKSRERFVPEDIVLITHEETAIGMYDFITRGFPRTVQGAAYVILNKREHTIFYKRPDGSDTTVVKDFKYIKFKDVGKPIRLEGDIKKELFDWIKDNIPRTRATEYIFQRMK